MRTILWILALSLAAAPAFAADYPTPDAATAQREMQLFFHYLKPDNGQKAKGPAWLEEALPKMSARMVWRDPDQGDLSEAQLWQAPASILYELFTAAAKTAPEELSAGDEADYSNLLQNYKMSLDRIRRSKLEDSFGGRGAGLLAAYQRVLEPLDGLVDAAAARDAEAFRRGADAAAQKARAAFALLSAEPQKPAGPSYQAKPRLLPGYRGFSLSLPAHQLAFIKKGQRADVLVTFEALLKGDVKEKVTATILQNVLVVDILRPDRPEGRGALLLLLNPNEAQYAALAALQGDVRVTARAEGDMEMHPMEMASLRKLFK